MTKIIHVNRQHIAMNAKDGGARPVYIVREPGRPVRYAHSVDVLGPSRFAPYGKRLPCGARAWLETEAELVLHGECSFQEARA